MAQFSEDEVYNRIIKRNPNLAKFNRQEVLNRVYSRNPKIKELVAPSVSTANYEVGGVTTPTAGMGLSTSTGALPSDVGARSALISPNQIKEFATAPGVLPAVGMMGAGLLGAPFLGGATLPYAVAGGAALAGLGAGTGEFAREKIAGEDISAKNIAQEAAIGATGEAVVRGAFIGGRALANATKESPYVRQWVSKLLASSSGGKESWANITKAIDRNLGKMIPQYDKQVSDIMSKTRKATVSATPLIERDATATLDTLQTQLKNLRTISGAKVEQADIALSKLADSKGQYIDTSDITKDIFDFTQGLKNADIANMPQVKTIIDNLDNLATTMAKNPAVSVGDAIKRKKTLNSIFATFKSGNMDISQSPIVNEQMSMVAKKLSDKVSAMAVKLGDKNYAKAYSNFGEFAEHYDLDIQPLLGAKRGDLSSLKKFQTIANNLNTQSLKNELLEMTAQKLPKGIGKKVISPVQANISKLTDQGVIYNLYRDLAASPSSDFIGKLRLVLSPVTKGYVRLAGSSKALATSPSKIAAVATGFNSPEEVKQAYRNGDISREQAESELKNNHGMK